MKLNPWMYLAAAAAAYWFIFRKPPAAGPEPMIQTQNLYIDP